MRTNQSPALLICSTTMSLTSAAPSPWRRKKRKPVGALEMCTQCGKVVDMSVGACVCVCVCGCVFYVCVCVCPLSNLSTVVRGNIAIFFSF